MKSDTFFKLTEIANAMDTLDEDAEMKDGDGFANSSVPLGSVDTSNHEPDYTDAHHILHALADGMCGVSMVVRPEHGIKLGMQHIVPVDQLLAYTDPDIRRSAMITFTDLLNSGSDQSWIWGDSGVAQQLYKKFLVFLHRKYEHSVVESACLAIAALVAHQPSHARGVLHPQSLAIFLHTVEPALQITPVCDSVCAYILMLMCEQEGSDLGEAELFRVLRVIKSYVSKSGNGASCSHANRTLAYSMCTCWRLARQHYPHWIEPCVAHGIVECALLALRRGQTL